MTTAGGAPEPAGRFRRPVFIVAVVLLFGVFAALGAVLLQPQRASLTQMGAVIVVTGDDRSLDAALEDNGALRRLRDRGLLEETTPPGLRDGTRVFVFDQDVFAQFENIEGLAVDRRTDLNTLLMRQEPPPERRALIARLQEASGAPVSFARSLPSDVARYVIQREGEATRFRFQLPRGEVSFSEFSVTRAAGVEMLRGELGGDQITAQIVPDQGYLSFSGIVTTESGRVMIESLGRGEHVLIQLADTDAVPDDPSEALLREHNLWIDEQNLDSGAWPYESCRQVSATDKVVTIGWFADRPTFELLTPSEPGKEPQLLRTAVTELNDALGRHRVADYRFELRNLLNQPYRDTPSYGLFEDARKLLDRGPPFEEVWRNAGGVDLLLLVVSNVQAGNAVADAACGYTPQLTNPRVIVVEYACLFSGRSTLQHEIGHAFGAAHDQVCCTSCRGDPNYRFDWRTQSEGTWLALWTCSNGNGARLSARYQQYSDPSLHGRGGPQANVARLIRERIPDMAQFGRCPAAGAR